MTTALLELEGIWARYRGRDARAPLAGVDLAVRLGEVCAVLGSNGAGKTTLVRVAAGLLPPCRGTARLGGDDVKTLDRRAIARRVAVLAQRCEAPGGFTTREVVAMGRAPHLDAWQRSGPADEVAVEAALEHCGLGAMASRLVGELSAGEQKRVHLARVLAQGAPLLVLDEATAHLDIGHAALLHELVRAEVDTGRAGCLAIVHDLEAARRHADRVVLMREGEVVANGPTGEVMTPAWLGRAFDAEIVEGERAFVARRRPHAVG